LAAGKLAAARPKLQRTLDSARAHLLQGIELETQLIFAELKKKQGQGVEAQADLVALEKLARDKGFGLIAGKASSARNSGTMEDSVKSRVLRNNGGADVPVTTRTAISFWVAKSLYVSTPVA
jgi:hypothetical protein